MGGPTRHGFTSKSAPHSLERKTFVAWQDIKTRCLNPTARSFKYYGARGIAMHFPWLASFERFLADVGPCPAHGMTIGREDNNGHYVPGNVRWETAEQQAHNKSNTRRLTMAGRTQSLTHWAHEVGLAPILVTTRLRAGWSIEKALTTPKQPRAPRK